MFEGTPIEVTVSESAQLVGGRSRQAGDLLSQWRGYGSDHGYAIEFNTHEFIVPYIEIPFPLDAVATIRVGPGPHVDVREEGVRPLLHAVGCGADVRRSEVPLRG
jgi:hypothetical protein